jgi:hypothetical protein
MPVYTVKNGQTLVLNKCPFCNEAFEKNPNSQFNQVLHVQMCGFNHDDKFAKQRKHVKRLNDKKSKKITNYFKK